ncbi:MAG: glycosyltransferase family 39 protein [Candidatus Saccharimonadales bacterium]
MAQLPLVRHKKRIDRSLPAWVDIIILALSIAIFYIIITPMLSSDSTYFDEGYSVYLAHLNIPSAVYYTSLDVHPPLYYIALHFWQMVFDSSIFVLRMMSVVWAAICIALAFFLVRRAFGRIAAWIILPFITFSPLFLRYSETARMYTMALAFCLAATYILVRLQGTVERKKRTVLWIIYGVFVAGGMWTNYFTALIWICHGLWVISERYILRNKEGKFILPKGWLSAIAMAVLLYIPWLPSLITRYKDIQDNGFWIKPISIDTISSTITTMTLLRPASSITSWLVIGIVGWIGVATWLVTRTYKEIIPTKKPLYRLVIIMSIGPIILLGLLSLPPFRPAYTYRYVLAGVFMSMLLIGVSLAIISFKKHQLAKKICIGMFLLIILVIGMFNFIHQGNRNLDTGGKSTVGDAVAQIDSQVSTIEPIIIKSPYTYYASMVYETKTHPIYYLYTESLKNSGVTRGLYDMPNERGIKDISTFIKKFSYVWILGEDKNDIGFSPSPTWKKVKSIIINDTDRGVLSSYAIQYQAP